MNFNVTQPFPLVRACVPLDTPTAWVANACPFQIISPQGVALVVQWEAVARNAAGLVTVAEFIAKNPAQEVGTFSVRASATSSDQRCKPLSFAAKWMNVPPMFARDGVAVPTTFDSKKDRHGNDVPVYARNGSVCVTRRFHARHFVGWVTVFDGLDIVGLDVDFHDGEINSGHLAFDQLDLPVVRWFETALPEPYIQSWLGGLVLVPARSDGLRHVLPQRTGRPFRLVLHDGTQSTQAAAYAQGAGWGCSQDWTRVGAFQPQALPLPDLSSKRLEAAHILANTWHAWRDAMQNGTSIGIGTQPGQPYPAQGSQTDWLHPGGQQYGGATSGSERYIWGFEGVLTVATGSYDGIRALLARSTLYAQRMPSLILDHMGRPALLESFLDASGAPLQGWRMSSANTQFDGNPTLDAPFGFSANSSAPINACPEFTEQLKYDELDFQHQDRWFQPLVSLAYLTNDPWSIWRLRCAAETWRMSQFSGHRLDNDYNAANLNPGHGTDMGRAHGECWTMCAAAYALSGDDFRTRWKTWLTKAVTVLLKAQMANGLLRSSVATSKDGSVFSGCWDSANNRPIYSVTKLSEESQLANFLQAYAGAVGTDLGLSNAIALWALGCQDFLASSFCAWAAVGPPDRTSPRYIGVSPLLDSHKDKEEVGACIGHGMWAGGTYPALLTAYTGSQSNPLAALLMKPLGQSPSVDDTSPMISKLQHP